MTDWKPSLYMPLRTQDAPRVQANLFALEPRTEPSCEHPEYAYQRDLFGETALCCTFCGKEKGE